MASSRQPLTRVTMCVRHNLYIINNINQNMVLKTIESILISNFLLKSFWFLCVLYIKIRVFRVMGTIFEVCFRSENGKKLQSTIGKKLASWSNYFNPKFDLEKRFYNPKNPYFIFYIKNTKVNPKSQLAAKSILVSVL